MELPPPPSYRGFAEAERIFPFLALLGWGRQFLTLLGWGRQFLPSPLLGRGQGGWGVLAPPLGGAVEASPRLRGFYTLSRPSPRPHTEASQKPSVSSLPSSVGVGSSLPSSAGVGSYFQASSLEGGRGVGRLGSPSWGSCRGIAETEGALHVIVSFSSPSYRGFAEAERIFASPSAGVGSSLPSPCVRGRGRGGGTPSPSPCPPARIMSSKGGTSRRRSSVSFKQKKRGDFRRASSFSSFFYTVYRSVRPRRKSAETSR